jgi:murein DD-endopeptidase MepM/ murein hydrolase activator NlpD
MFRPLLSIVCLLFIVGCTQKPAPVDYRGSYFYGQDGPMGNNGMEIPKYSNHNRADMPDDQEAKYVSPVHDYGVAAEVGDVSSTDLPPPTALTPAPPPAQAIEAYKSGQQGTVVEPALKRTGEPGEGYYDYKAQTNVPPLNEIQSVNQQPPSTADANARASNVDYYAQESAEAEGRAPPQFIWPVRGDVAEPYTAATKGMRIRAMKGDPVRATEDGKVQSTGPSGAAGMTVTLSHKGGWSSQYGQLGETVVRLGDSVVRGQLIGFVGAGSNGGQSQLFFGLYQMGSPADPRALLVED